MKPTKARRVFTFFNLLFLTLLMIVCIIPLWHILCISVSENRYAVAGQVGMWPMGFTLEAYSFMAEKSNFVNGLFVSLQRVSSLPRATSLPPAHGICVVLRSDDVLWRRHDPHVFRRIQRGHY